jgi:adenylate cyclase
MPDLIAQGVEAQQRWRRSLPETQAVTLGRTGGIWAVPWDHQVSRQHVQLRWTDKGLEVTRLPEARNPVFHRGQEVQWCLLAPGDHFVIGQTTFTLADQRANIAADVPEPVQQQSFSAQYLRQVPFRHPDHRIEVLSRLPDVISGAAGDAELFVRLVSMLLAGVPRADAAAIVASEALASEGPAPHAVRVLHLDQRLAISNDFRPSQGLILEALRQGQSVLHVWRGADSAPAVAFTESETFDWAFCTPVLARASLAPSKGTVPLSLMRKSGQSPGWGLYVAGRFDIERAAVNRSSDPDDLREDVKFTELVAAMLSSLREMRLLERRHATLSQFFSPVVLETLAVEDPDLVLAPRETSVSVMFCDLRGFSRETERYAGYLLGLLQRVSKALGVMTHHIRQQGGVVGDFQGDAAMGFWGWPLPQPDAVLRTSRAALAIRAEFEATAGFHAGIGVATGRAVAGKIGTVDQVKVTVFGPVANLASRLEGMTKLLGAPILLDQAMARAIRAEVPRDVARVRRLAVVRPYGLEMPLEVSELLPPESQYPQLSDEHLRHYEAALDAFLAGRWQEAFQFLHRIPSEDRGKDFLTVYIAQHGRTPPPDWDGVIRVGSKS